VALKGNLLFNGDFETGTTEGWECGAFGQSCACLFSASTEAKYRGNYGGLLVAHDYPRSAYLAYDKICSFEEYEAYLYIFYSKLVSGYYVTGLLYGLDDKENLIQNFRLGFCMEEGEWRKYICLLRGYKDITHFKVGVLFWGSVQGDKCYFDEAKLIPLRSIKGHEIKDYRFFDNVTADKEWWSGISSFGKAKLRSVLQVANVSGTSPTLDTEIECYLFEGANMPFILEHSQFTGEGGEIVSIDLPEVAIIKVKYTIGGTDPSFDIYHNLILEPY